MLAIDIQNQPDRYVISIDKNAMHKDELLRFLENLQLEQLARKIDFDDSLLTLGEEIKINTNWWQVNKHRFVGEGS